MNVSTDGHMHHFAGGVKGRTIPLRCASLLSLCASIWSGDQGFGVSDFMHELSLMHSTGGSKAWRCSLHSASAGPLLVETQHGSRAS